MDEAFIIMQIGDADMDAMCDEVFVPVIKACGLKPNRVDRDNTGDLLKAEIVAFLEGAQIIVADLTNERPNCYLEVGYAMGLGKKRNLILTVREDHHHRSKNYRLDGPRVHFDLEGYDLLLWDPKDLDGFRKDLELRIRRRLAVIEPTVTGEPATVAIPIRPAVDQEWFDEQRARAKAGLKEIELSGFMEASVALLPKGTWRQAELRAAVEASQINTFGWPIGIVMSGQMRPQATSEGVRGEVAFAAGEGTREVGSYDFWYMRQTGDFYLLQSLFEDERGRHVIFFDTRVVRTTELLLFLARCYSRLDVPDSTALHLDLVHGALEGRELGVASQSRSFTFARTTREDEVSSSIDCTVGELQTKLADLVKELLDPLFMVFDFFEADDEVVRQIVDDFVAGKIV